MTLTINTDLVRRLRAPGYFILVMAMLFPFVDLVLSVLPAHPGVVAWRFALLGLLATALTAPMLMLLLFYGLATLAGDRKVVLLAGIVASIFALVMAISMAAFSLDALQMKSQVQPEASTRFLAACFQALVKMALEIPAAIILAVSAFRTARLKSSAEKADRPARDAMLVARPSATRPAVTEPVEQPRIGIKPE